MSITFDEALAATAPKRDTRCTVGKAIGELTDDQRAKVNAALADNDNFQTSHLARAVAMMAGIKIDPQTLGRHRKGGCNCGS